MSLEEWEEFRNKTVVFVLLFFAGLIIMIFGIERAFIGKYIHSMLLIVPALFFIISSFKVYDI
jgi:hypothetical protein